MSFLELGSADKLHLAGILIGVLCGALALVSGYLWYNHRAHKSVAKSAEADMAKTIEMYKNQLENMHSLVERAVHGYAPTSKPKLAAMEAGGKLGMLLIAINGLVGKLEKIEAPISAAVGALPSGLLNQQPPAGIIDEIAQVVATIDNRLDVLASQARLLQ